LLKLLLRHCLADKSTTRQSPRTLSGPRPGGLRQSLVGTVQWNSDIMRLQPPSCDNNSRSRGGGGWSMGIMNGRMAGLRYRSSSCAVSIDTANRNCRSLIVLTTNEQHAPKKSKNYRMLALNVTICYLTVVRLCTVSITATHTHTHTRLMALSRTTWVSQYRKVKPMSILLKQQTMSGSGISWAMSALRSRQITMPAPHHSVFYRPDALRAAQPTASKH